LIDHFDLGPNQILRAAQLDQDELIFESKSPWLCASCQTCTTRCPQGIDVAKVMDFIVIEAMASGTKPKVPEVALFQKVFLRNVDILGRAYELGLMAERNIRSGHLFKDLDLGIKMAKHGKIKFLPEVVRRGRRQIPDSPPQREPNEIGYYPGCSLHAMASEYDLSTRAVLDKLGFLPVEPQEWVCCGSTPAHRVDHHLATKLPIENLSILEQEGLREVTLPCASCYSRFRAAAHEIREDADLKVEINKELDVPYKDQVEIYSLIEFLSQRVSLGDLAVQVDQSLEGLNVACYYGCLLTRPPSVTGSSPVETEYPLSMDRLLNALGATTIDWDHKVSCCGAALSLTFSDVVKEMSGKILENAKSRGADVVAVACPLCHANLENFQSETDSPIPTMFFTQLMALAFNLPEKAGLHRNMVDPRPILREKELLS
jgi:heterodisulfide reductase subunit B